MFFIVLNMVANWLRCSLFYSENPVALHKWFVILKRPLVRLAQGIRISQQSLLFSLKLNFKLTFGNVKVFITSPLLQNA